MVNKKYFCVTEDIIYNISKVNFFGTVILSCIDLPLSEPKLIMSSINIKADKITVNITA